MKKAIYPGTFDPITNGHVDLIKRTAAITDELIVGVLVNKNKKPMFTEDERVEMIKDAVKDLENVRVITFEGLLADLAKQEDAVVIRGLRNAGDFEYELPMAQGNCVLEPGVETLFIAAAPEWAFLSSSMVREIASFGGDISKLVPEKAAQMVKDRTNNC